MRRSRSLFRGRYKAILVQRDRYLLAVARYIHKNPVAANFVSQAEQYRWSTKPWTTREKRDMPDYRRAHISGGTFFFLESRKT
jgi:hypothetical protein